MILSNKKHFAYLDFIKGFAIISVILLHTLDVSALHKSFAVLHIWQAIPLFVFISFFLLYLKIERIGFKSYYAKKEILKVIKRIVAPFVLVELLLVFGGLIIGKSVSILDIFKGIGKGSYYPYIYLQIWLIAPLIYYLLSKIKSLQGLIIGIISSFLINYLVLILVKDNYSVYRMLFTRYFFLSILAFLFYKSKLNIYYLIILSIISIIYWFIPFKFDIVPLGDSNWGWTYQQWPAFFYTWLFLCLLRYIHNKIKRCRILEWMGRNSYTIFLSQMFWLSFIKYNTFNFIHYPILQRLVFVIVTFCISILPSLLLSRYKLKKLYEKLRWQ